MAESIFGNTDNPPAPAPTGVIAVAQAQLQEFQWVIDRRREALPGIRDEDERAAELRRIEAAEADLAEQWRAVNAVAAEWARPS